MMKILLIKTASIINTEKLKALRDDFQKQISEGLLVLDGGFDYEIIDTDIVNKQKRKHEIQCYVGVTAGSELCNYCIIRKKCGALKCVNTREKDMDT